MLLRTEHRHSAAAAWLAPAFAAAAIGVGTAQLPLDPRAAALIATGLACAVALCLRRAAARPLADAPEQQEAQRQGARRQLIQAQNMEAIGNFAGGIAHEYNNLFGTIIGNLDLLRDAPGREQEIDELSRDALTAALKGAELTRGLLAFAGRQPLQPRRVDLNALIGGLAAPLRRSLGERIELALDLEPHCWPVLADPKELEAALSALAAYARDSMAKGGRLRIATANRRLDENHAARSPGASPGEHVMIEIEDSGMGVTPELLGRIFEPFSAAGTRGLGLSTVFGFVIQSGGHIAAESTPGAGTTFRLFLPRARDDARSGEPPPHGKGETVLAVDDDEAWRRLATRHLADLGYGVREAENAAAAIAILESEPAIDLVFSDVAMPGRMDGRGLANAIRRRWPRVKVVLTSGLAPAKVFDGSLPAATPLLSKPYRKEDLARTLRDALDARPVTTAAPLPERQERGVGHGAHSGD